jgi:predicted aspartyl protease
MDGFIDHLRRPIVRIEGPQPNSAGLLCLIDTGYNGYLLLEQSRASDFGFQTLSQISDQVVLGDGSIRLVEIARGTVRWFGANLLIDAHVIPDPVGIRYTSPEHQIESDDWYRATRPAPGAVRLPKPHRHDSAAWCLY